MTESGDTALPLEEVHTPTLDEWAEDGHRRIDSAWANWVDPGTEYRVDVEMIDLEEPERNRVTYAFEVELVTGLHGDGRDQVRLRETIHNSRLTLYVAEFVATHADAFAVVWDEDLAPRPSDVD